MIFLLYETTTPNNVLRKIVGVSHDINIFPKSDFDVVNPVIRLKTSPGLDFKKYNYARIVDVDRYYFINSIEYVHANIVELSLECDVLMTYQDDIKNSTARYSRNIKTGDYLDTAIDMSVLKTASQHDSDTNAFVGKPTIILTTVGA